MRKQLLSYVLGTAAAMVAANSIAAPIPAPNVWWAFDNEDGQSAGTYDGYWNPSIYPAGLYNNYKLYNGQYNGIGEPGVTGGNTRTSFQLGASAFDNNAYASPVGATTAAYPYNYRTTPAVNAPYVGAGVAATLPASIAPPEYYVTGPGGSGTAMHMSGGTHYRYNPDSDGNPILNPQTDALVSNPVDSPVVGLAAQVPFSPNIDSFRDRPTFSGAGGGTATTAAGTRQDPGINSAGNAFAYGFWLNIQEASQQDNDSNSAHSQNTSFVISRNSGNFAGSVGVGHTDNVAGSNNYILNVFGSGSQTNTVGANKSTMQVSKGTWHHWVVQWDLTGTGTVTLWRDGGGVGNKEVFTGMGIGAINGVLRLNNAPFGQQQNQHGDFYLDDLLIWNNVLLTDADVARLYQLGVEQALVPEPSSFALASLALVSLTGFRRKQRVQK